MGASWIIAQERMEILAGLAKDLQRPKGERMKALSELRNLEEYWGLQPRPLVKKDSS